MEWTIAPYLCSWSCTLNWLSPSSTIHILSVLHFSYPQLTLLLVSVTYLAGWPRSSSLSGLSPGHYSSSTEQRMSCSAMVLHLSTSIVPSKLNKRLPKDPPVDHLECANHIPLSFHFVTGLREIRSKNFPSGSLWMMVNVPLSLLPLILCLLETWDHIMVIDLECMLACHTCSFKGLLKLFLSLHQFGRFWL